MARSWPTSSLKIPCKWQFRDRDSDRSHEQTRSYTNLSLNPRLGVAQRPRHTQGSPRCRGPGQRQGGSGGHRPLVAPRGARLAAARRRARISEETSPKAWNVDLAAVKHLSHRIFDGGCGGSFESPLTDSNRRAPPHHGGSGSVFAYMAEHRRVRFPCKSAKQAARSGSVTGSDVRAKSKERNGPSRTRTKSAQGGPR
jgi:hypothetical protein